MSELDIGTVVTFDYYNSSSERSKQYVGIITDISDEFDESKVHFPFDKKYWADTWQFNCNLDPVKNPSAVFIDGGRRDYRFGDYNYGIVSMDGYRDAIVAGCRTWYSFADAYKHYWYYIDGGAVLDIAKAEASMAILDKLKKKYIRELSKYVDLTRYRGHLLSSRGEML